MRILIFIFLFSLVLPVYSSENTVTLGYELTSRQIDRGARKKVEGRYRGQSFQGLLDIVMSSDDPEIHKSLFKIAYLMERQKRAGIGTVESYTKGFVKDLLPIAKFIEENTGFPSSILISQAVIESGWGMSNITILKNNILGIGNGKKYHKFYVNIEIGECLKRIRVRTLIDTTAYCFDSVEDCVLYYAHLLLYCEDNEKHYGNLRKYMISHETIDPKKVIHLMAKSYHSDPEWYERYVRQMMRVVDKIIDEIE